jgi:gliding motility-associated-like protein
MKRFLLVISASFFLSAPSFANHITGGQIFYTYAGQSGNLYNYNVSLWLYRDHFSAGAPLDAFAPIAIFDKATGAIVWSGSVPSSDTIHEHLTSPSPCITDPPTVWYEVGRYNFSVSLPASTSGYIIAYQRCCRIAGINNLSGASSNVGVTYTAEIPGTQQLATAPENNSAKFIGADTVIICAGNAFTYSFAAQDADGDQLSYSFCDAYSGGSSGAPTPNPPAGPPYIAVPYSGQYEGFSPLGGAVTLNSSTGLISGIAPPSGIYVVTVCVTETRNGIIIATQRKDLQIKIGDCNIAKAALNPQYITCDGFTMNFANLNSSPLINSFFWDFGVTSASNDTSTLATPTFTYPDTGIYILKLVTNRNQQCSDSTTAVVKVFPGFFPGFISTGTCINFPIRFTDTTKAAYGLVNTWSWIFGEPNTANDTSHLQNPSWLYATPGTKNVQFIVSSSKGCMDTVFQNVDVLSKPVITLAFRDTLICITDQVQLQASGNGIFSWTPLINIINPSTGTPTVSPPVTTWYYVDLDESSCLNRDSVRVRVVNFVTLAARADTTICLTDDVQLGANTDGLQFQWSPALTLNNPNIVNPKAIPVDPVTTYQILARIGSCTATDNVTITTVPYPFSRAGNDTVICYNTTAQLNGSYTGISFSWSPPSYLNNPAIINPVAAPPRTTSYILSVLDNKGCPKPGRDTIVVTVLPKVNAFAGHDTTVVVGQPLHFNASGGINYLWSPPTGLSNVTIANPTAIYTPEVDSVTYKLVVTDQAGCSDSAFVSVKVFKTNPYVFVPTAFTPNGDGRNDVIRPIAVGIQKINYFSIYNRWGQLLFTTTVNGRGWDGKIAGVPQGTGTFVWMVSAIDYTGKPLFLKGTTTLIR